MTITNPCNPSYINGCADRVGKSHRKREVINQHNWGTVFRAGVSYTYGVQASFKGVGASQEFTVNMEKEKSTGGSYTTSEEVSSTQICSARPMTSVTCQYIAYEGTIEVGYTITWKNAAKTRGTYRGKGWKSVLTQSVINI